MADTEYIHRAVCKYCLKESGMAEFDIPIKESGSYSGEVTVHTVTITQCLNCKMIQPQED